MKDHLEEKKAAIKEKFARCTTMESKYEKLIELGRALPTLNPEFKIDANHVKGCQSKMYLHSRLEGDYVVFEVESDALISAGLGALLVLVYSGEKPETVLTSPPDYLEDLGIKESLTPNRANGLYNIFLRMKQEALRLIVEREKRK